MIDNVSLVVIGLISLFCLLVGMVMVLLFKVELLLEEGKRSNRLLQELLDWVKGK